LPVDATEKEIERSKEMSSLHERIGLLEMTGHKFLDKNFRMQQTTFSDGTIVTVDFDTKKYHIETGK
jgi:hypothetical protein